MTPERTDKLIKVLSKRQSNLTVVMENVQDPHNISAVLRTCDAVGIQDIYILTTKISLKFRNFFAQKINFVGVCDEQAQCQEVVDMIDIGVIDFISINYKLINKDFLKKIQPTKLLTWTVNDIKEINDLYMFGVEKFATDKVLI